MSQGRGVRGNDTARKVQVCVWKGGGLGEGSTSVSFNTFLIISLRCEQRHDIQTTAKASLNKALVGSVLREWCEGTETHKHFSRCDIVLVTIMLQVKQEAPRFQLFRMDVLRLQ